MIKVAQCWDDGPMNDLHLTELFRKYNAKATFNLNPGFMQEKRIPSTWEGMGADSWSYLGYHGGKLSLNDIKDVYDGFEVASHCWKHENLEVITPEAFVKAALDARHYLEDIKQRPCLGFAWPCGRYTPELLDMMKEAGFAYGRTTKYTTNPSSYEHPMALHSNCHHADWEFYKKYEQAKKDGCEFFYFWGHSYELLEYDKLWEQLENRIKYISEDPDSEWVNVIDIVKK